MNKNKNYKVFYRGSGKFRMKIFQFVELFNFSDYDEASH